MIFSSIRYGEKESILTLFVLVLFFITFKLNVQHTQLKWVSSVFLQHLKYLTRNRHCLVFRLFLFTKEPWDLTDNYRHVTLINLLIKSFVKIFCIVSIDSQTDTLLILNDSILLNKTPFCHHKLYTVVFDLV